MLATLQLLKIDIGATTLKVCCNFATFEKNQSHAKSCMQLCNFLKIRAILKVACNFATFLELKITAMPKVASNFATFKITAMLKKLHGHLTINSYPMIIFLSLNGLHNIAGHMVGISPFQPIAIADLGHTHVPVSSVFAGLSRGGGGAHTILWRARPALP